MARPIINLINKKFGKWKVIKRVKNRNERPYFLCKCECGTEKEVDGASLRYSRSIRCLNCRDNFRKPMGSKYHLVNKIFGNLKVISGPNRKDYKNLYYTWNCQCKCGNTLKVLTRELINGNRIDCGKCKYSKVFQGKLGCYEELRSKYLQRIISGAKARNLKFNLNKKYLWNLYIKQNKKCALSGISINFENYATKEKATASLDRIDSSKGYVKGNVQWVHKHVNKMKQDFSDAYFIQMCKKIAKNNKNVE